MILAGGVLALVVVWYLGHKAAQVATAAVDTGAGILSGNNAITASARTDAYQGAGVLGTLGAATDNLSGGVLSKAGQWLGSSLYDWTHPTP